jgi:AcrR family transcriptional regulator
VVQEVPDDPRRAGDAAGDDPLREQLLDAAARVFAEKGYAGTKIMDIVKAAGLSSGAVYGRFSSKDELLMEAILSRYRKHAATRRQDDRPVAEMLVEASSAEGALSDAEAMELEAYAAARRESEVAGAIAEGRKRWRSSIRPLVRKAVEDGTASPHADLESVLYFMQTVRLGLLVQRGAGLTPADHDAWMRFMERLVATMAGRRDRR